MYKLAAEQGQVIAMYNLGICYLQCSAVKYYKEAFMWYKLAAEQGHANAQNSLGFCYKRGLGVAKNAKKAFKWFKLSTDQGNHRAQTNLGECYHKGIGVAKNEEEAVKYYKLASEQGFAQAKYMLAHIYEYKKKKLLTEAAAQAHQGAQIYLDIHYKRKRNPTTYDDNTSKRNCIDKLGEL